MPAAMPNRMATGTITRKATPSQQESVGQAIPQDLGDRNLKVSDWPRSPIHRWPA